MSVLSSTIDRIAHTLRWVIVAVVLCYLILLLLPVFSQGHTGQPRLKEADTELCRHASGMHTGWFIGGPGAEYL